MGLGLVIICDLTLTPFLLAWGVPFDGTILTFSQVSLTFWTLDMALSFTTGFYRDGELILSFKEIAKHYLKTTFAPDFLAIERSLHICNARCARGARRKGRVRARPRLFRTTRAHTK